MEEGVGEGRGEYASLASGEMDASGSRHLTARLTIAVNQSRKHLGHCKYHI